MGCNIIYLCEYSNSLCENNNWIFNYYSWRNCYNYCYLFFIAFYILIHRGHRFRKINNAIVREYHENKNGELFLEKLLAIEEKATFFIAFYILIHRGHRFRKINNAIVREYHENKNGELFLEKLLAIEEKATDMNEEIIWYLNIATAFSVSGKRNESISLLKQLEEVATEKDKEYIRKSIEFIKEQIENGC